MSPDARIGTGSKVSRGTTGCDVCHGRCGNVGRGSAPNEPSAADSARSAPRGRSRPRRQGLCPRRPAGRRRRASSRGSGTAVCTPSPRCCPARSARSPAALSLSAGILLLLLAHGLRRGKRRAWRAAVVLLPAGAVAQFMYRHSIVGALISRGAAGAAAAAPRPVRGAARPAQPLARARQLRPHGRRFPRSSGWSSSASTRTGWSATRAWPIASRTSCTACSASRARSTTRATPPGRSAFSLGALGLLTAVTTIYLAFRPEHPAARLTEDDESRLRALLAKHGRRDSLGHFALRRDKAVVFSPSGKAAVTYRVVSGVMLASGDPIGDVEAWPGAIERFMDEAKAHSWTPGRHGLLGDRRRGVDPGDRPGRPRTGRRGGGGRRGFLPRRPRDAQRAADGQAHRARRLRNPGTARA